MPRRAWIARRRKTIAWVLLVVLAFRLWPWFGTISGLNVAGAVHGFSPDVASLPPAAAPAEIRSGLSRIGRYGLQFAAELLFSPRVVRRGHGFKRDDPALPPASAEQLAAVLADPATYEPWSGYKLCGGFHGDWYLRWGSGSDRRELIICENCHEVLLFSDGRSIRCDLSQTGYDRIVAVTATPKTP